ncbi:MAG: glycoside hydrolase family 38 C-terminal domain-containing protein [Cyanobacteriota bacterium]|nr:glycoside hydrolase family 38 C-terminal domain-containing protein [Cyanobacteriota bacterium]
MPEAPEVPLPERIETFQSSFALDLQPRWLLQRPDGSWDPALGQAWGVRHRPDWHRRGLIIVPRGGREQWLRLSLACPPRWRSLAGVARARLVLRWWAEAVELRLDTTPVHRGDLFDSACRWVVPGDWWHRRTLELELRLRSPLHDDGALVHSRIELEPLDADDPHGLLQPRWAELAALRQRHGVSAACGGGLHVLGHAHLDLAWLWPVADTWQAAERTFSSVLALMERFPELHFAHSTPALYAWLQTHRPALFARLCEAVAAGRFEPINGPWVETDCVLISTASLLRQFQLGQQWSRCVFPTLQHNLAWLPDSFGFGAGLPAVARATGVSWFCTHKLAWNATTPFPHRLFRWRSRCGSELLALMTAPIGSGADPLDMEQYRLQWRQATGLEQALWLPGVGDHGGGPTAEMLEQLALWQRQAQRGAPVAGQTHGSLRAYLQQLEPLAPQLPIWRDELYLELHRGCATSRPDQKRHNRSLERLLREADLARSLAGQGAGSDWKPLLFQQFHDILPGTSIPEVFEQAGPQVRQARRQSRCSRDKALIRWLMGGRTTGLSPAASSRPWWLAQLQPLESRPACLRLPGGGWSLEGCSLASQPARAGGVWVQIPGLSGVAAVQIDQRMDEHATGQTCPVGEERVRDPVTVTLEEDGFLIGNRWVRFRLGPRGVQQLWGSDGREQLSGPLDFRRYRDCGEFWDAWDIAADYADHPLPWCWHGRPELLEKGPLCVSFLWRGHCGSSAVRLDGRLLAGSRCLELTVTVDWRQRHELLRLEVPLATRACRWAADTSGGVIERPAAPLTPREQARWEVTAVSWLCSVAAAGQDPGGLAVLLDGPQGVSGADDRLGVSLLRAPTWPDPAADNGYRRQRLALRPYCGTWSSAEVPAEALRLREPLWCRPAPVDGLNAAAPWLPRIQPGLVFVSVRPGSEWTWLAVQNLSPRRRRLELGPRWRLMERTDGLDQPLDPQPSRQGLGLLRPWEIGFWRMEALPGAQSS